MSDQLEADNGKVISRPKPLVSPHRVLLETSFTSLQAEPGTGTATAAGTTTSLGSSTGLASSSTGGVRWSSGPPIAPLPAALSPGLSWEHSPNAAGSLQTVTRKVDLIHDDWLGLAPLATPESLSEVSSISSRTSSSRTSSYDRAASREYFSICAHSRLSSGSSQKLEDVVLVQGPGENAPTFPIILQSNERTPRVLRRTPKINGNLSSAAEDLGSNLKYAMTNINLASFAVRRNLPVPVEDESKSTASEDEDGLSEPVRRRDLGVLSRQGSVKRSRVVTSVEGQDDDRGRDECRDECSSHCECLSASPCSSGGRSSGGRSSGGPSRRIAPEALPLLRNIGLADDNDSLASFVSGSSKKYNCSVVAVSKGESSV